MADTDAETTRRTLVWIGAAIAVVEGVAGLEGASFALLAASITTIGVVTQDALAVWGPQWSMARERQVEQTLLVVRVGMLLVLWGQAVALIGGAPSGAWMLGGALLSLGGNLARVGVSGPARAALGERWRGALHDLVGAGVLLAGAWVVMGRGERWPDWLGGGLWSVLALWAVVKGGLEEPRSKPSLEMKLLPPATPEAEARGARAGGPQSAPLPGGAPPRGAPPT